MSSPAPHTDPFALAFQAMEDSLVERIADRLSTATRSPALDDAPTFDPLEVLDAKDVAQVLGTSRVASVYEISEDELPRVRRIGSSVGFLRINVLLYMHHLPPIDMPALLETYRERLMNERPAAVRAMHSVPETKTRVL